jgi:hypothetical protein
MVQNVDFREVTFYIYGGCFPISFEKWPKEPRERIRTICTTSLLRKKMIFECTTFRVVS